MGGQAAIRRNIMDSIKSIEFTFENCEGIKLPINVLGACHLDKIYTKIDRLAMNAIIKTTYVDEVALEIFFPEAEKHGIKCPVWNEEDTIFKRLCDFRDITHITIYYEDDTTETFCVDYKDEVEGQLGSNNLNQKTYISSCGNIYIVIAANKNIDDFFDRELIENEESMQDIKELYS